MEGHGPFRMGVLGLRLVMTIAFHPKRSTRRVPDTSAALGGQELRQELEQRELESQEHRDSTRADV